ncbi:methyltransferase [Haloferula sp. BvORR071]|uniref:class I SAM-dependent methyltransferase n=1 Tax=Haloferula sp. BvORR071 TaxID=1396141 RepID=UPI0006976177|nr:methyltransferase [Haloferula sp. BvORR071]
MSPALETLLLPFSRGEFTVPKQALFLGAEPHPDLKEWPEVTGWQPSKPLADAWEKAGFGRMEQTGESWPLVMLLPGKSREETLAAFARGYDLLRDGGSLVVAIANTAGAARFEKDLQEVAGKVDSVQKHKCRCFRAVKTAAWNAATLAEWRQFGEPRQIPSTEFIVEAGIFSADHIDPGSALLAEHLPANFRGSVADLGAGWGFLSRAVLEKNLKLKALHLYEADARALACARKNLPETAVPIEYHWHDVSAGLPNKYENIVMNPPFHSGQSTDISLGRAFLRTAADSLRTGGRLFMVANRQLPYEPELERLGLVWRKVAEDSVYKVIFAERRMLR